jgi:hypothetical protein
LDPTRVIEARVSSSLEKARALAAIDVISLEDVDRKARLHDEAAAALGPLNAVADAVVGSALAAAGGEGKDEEDGDDDGRPIWLRVKKRAGWEGRTDNLTESIATRVEQAFAEDVEDDAHLRALGDIRDQAGFWLDTGRPDLALDRNCLHWPLAFPEVFLAPGRVGFDAIVGNPPFLGGQRITGALGIAYRDYLVEVLARGRRGSADLVSYFFLRAFALLGEPGGFGLLATNTIAQGDTREVGLDQLAGVGATITRAVPSEPWPGTTSLEVAKVWVRKGEWRGPHVLSGMPVRAISPMLVIPGRAVGKPYRLKANEGKSFQGSIVLGMGFVMTPEAAQALIDKDPRNREVLFPYLNGEDLNSRPDQSPSRWVINFRDWPLERSVDGRWEYGDSRQQTDWRRSGRVPKDYPDPVAADFPDCLEIVRTKVKPERERNNRAVYRDRWWQYAEKRPELYATIEGQERVLVTAQTSNKWAPAFEPTGIVYSHTIVVFPCSDAWHYTVMQSVLHEHWRLEYGASLKQDARYTPSDCYDTFPFPTPSASLDAIGEQYHGERAAITRVRVEGLTPLYKRFHHPANQDSDVRRLRQLQTELDHQVVACYGWSDIELNHDFHETKQGIRFSVNPVARQALIDRLLELNHQRHAEEMHEESKSMNKSGTSAKKGKKPPKTSPLLEGV